MRRRFQRLRAFFTTADKPPPNSAPTASSTAGNAGSVQPQAQTGDLSVPPPTSERLGWAGVTEEAAAPSADERDAIAAVASIVAPSPASADVAEPTSPAMREANPEPPDAALEGESSFLAQLSRRISIGVSRFMGGQDADASPPLGAVTEEEIAPVIDSSAKASEPAGTSMHAPDAAADAVGSLAAQFASPTTRATSLSQLSVLWDDLKRQDHVSWTTECEFLPPDHPTEPVTAATLQAHRDVRSEAERLRNGVPRTVRYESIPVEELNTNDVVELVVRPVAHETHLSYAAARFPAASVGKPTHFVSHAWARRFGHLVRSLQAYFAGAVPAEVFVWLDIFAINQDTGRAMVELDDGKTLARVVELSAATLVVLEGDAFALSRLWCLYEIGSTPVHKLELLTHGTSAADGAAMAARVNAETALWCVRGPRHISRMPQAAASCVSPHCARMLAAMAHPATITCAGARCRWCSLEPAASRTTTSG